MCESCPPPMAGETDYSAEGGVEDLEEIDISWVSGPVELRPYDGSTVRVTEYSKYPLEEGQRLWMRIAEENYRSAGAGRRMCSAWWSTVESIWW